MIMDFDLNLIQIQIYRRLELWCTALKENSKSGGFGGVFVWLCVVVCNICEEFGGDGDGGT